MSLRRARWRNTSDTGDLAHGAAWRGVDPLADMLAPGCGCDGSADRPDANAAISVRLVLEQRCAPLYKLNRHVADAHSSDIARALLDLVGERVRQPTVAADAPGQCKG